MRTVGIVVEYNPFHNGHLYHLQQAQQVSGAEAVVAVMSGYFLQRGEPALLDKWMRAEMALRSGADLVLEIPTVYACQPAEWFAYGAVATLEATGVVDYLCFGSESGGLAPLQRLARTVATESKQLTTALKRFLKKGYSYPRAYSAALTELHPDAFTELTQPNNVLGLGYLTALHQLNSRIEPLTVRREKSGYNETRLTDARIASATAIRKKWLETGDLTAIHPYVPQTTYDLLARAVSSGVRPVTWEALRQAIFTKIATLSPEELRAIYDVGEGLEYRLQRQLFRAAQRHAKGTDNRTDRPLATEAMEAREATDVWANLSVYDYIAALKTKRYTWTHLQRILTYVLLGLRKSDLTRSVLDNGPSYIRVLGFTPRGRTLLKTMKARATVPILTRIGRERPPMLECDLRAAAVYTLASEARLPLTVEYERAPVYVGETERSRTTAQDYSEGADFRLGRKASK